MRFILAVCLSLAVSPVAGQDARPPAEMRAPAPDIDRPAMTFRIVEGVGAREGTRWVSASGAITSDTPAVFERFKAQENLNGLTVYLDSFGGRVLGGLRLGRAFRAAGLTVSVGRTIEDGRLADGRPRHVLITHGVACNSACVYALMGGEKRIVSRSVRLGVHQFSGRLAADNRPVDAQFGREEFRFAQRRMADIAIYMQDMGVDLKLLGLISETPYGEPLRYLRREEIQAHRLASVSGMPRDEPLEIPWLRFTRADDPWIVRRVVRNVENGRRIDDDLFVRCGPNDQFQLSFRQSIVDPGTSTMPVTWDRIRFSSGPEEHVWRRPREGGPGPVSSRGSALWIFTSIPRSLVEQMARTGTLNVEIAQSATAIYQPPLAMGDGRLTETARAFLTACREIPLRRVEATTRP